MKTRQSFVFTFLFLLIGCGLRQVENHTDAGFDNEITLIQVQPNQNQRLVVSHSESAPNSNSFQVTYQEIDAAGKSQLSKVLELTEILDSSAVYRGLHPVSFGSMLFGFVLLIGQDEIGEMQGFLFVWNGAHWHYDAATKVLLNNLTAESDVDARLEKVFPYNGLNKSVRLMAAQDIQSAKQVLGDVFFPEVRVSSAHAEEFLLIAKLDTGSASVFLLEQFADGLNIHRLPSPMDSTIPLACKPLEASIKKCGANAVTSLSIVYNCQSPIHNQGGTEVNLFENHNNSWILQSQSMCDQNNKTDK